MGSSQSLPPVVVETRLNLNRKVKVRLTDRGEAVLMARLIEEFGLDATERLQAIRRRRDGEFYVFQMYELMALFGNEMPVTATADQRHNLFKDNDIILVPDPMDVERR